MRLPDSVHTARSQRIHEADRGSAAATMSAVIGISEIPEPDRAASSLPDADYADAFAISTEVVATPEQWARAMFGDIPSLAERLIWRGLLGIRLSRGRSPHTVAGWRIAERDEHWIRLEACSWFLSANLVVRATDGRISLATFVRYDRSIGRVLWPPLSAIHRRLAPGLLDDAAEIRAPRRVTGSPPRAGSAASGAREA